MLVLGIILAILILILLMRFGVLLAYGEGGFRLSVIAGPVRIVILPKKEGKSTKQSKKKKEKSKKPAAAEGHSRQKGGKVQTILELLPAVGKFLVKFKRKLLIQRLIIHYGHAGADDPCQAAMRFGYTSVGMGILVPFFENNFRIRMRDFQTYVDFTASEPVVYLELKFSLALWEILPMSFGFLVDFLKIAGKNKNRKAVS